MPDVLRGVPRNEWLPWELAAGKASVVQFVRTVYCALVAPGSYWTKLTLRSARAGNPVTWLLCAWFVVTVLLVPPLVSSASLLLVNGIQWRLSDLRRSASTELDILLLHSVADLLRLSTYTALICFSGARIPLRTAVVFVAPVAIATSAVRQALLGWAVVTQSILEPLVSLAVWPTLLIEGGVLVYILWAKLNSSFLYCSCAVLVMAAADQWWVYRPGVWLCLRIHGYAAS